MPPESEKLQRALALRLLLTRKHIFDNASPYAPRASQLDAAALDATCYEEFLERLMNAFPSRLGIQDVADELRLGLKSWVFFFTVGRGLPTPGQALLGIRYTDRKGDEICAMQKACLFVCSILFPYFFTKFSNTVRHYPYLMRNEERVRMEKLHVVVQRLFSLCSFFNTLHFVATGKGVGERLCGVVCRAVETAPRQRSIEGDSVNWMVLWQHLSQFLVILTSFSSSRSVNRILSKLGLAPNLRRPERSGAAGCPVCERQIMLTPFVCEPCGHVYCYHCVMTHLSSLSRQTRFHCLECGHAVNAIRRCS